MPSPACSLELRQAGGLILESTKGTGEVHSCSHAARLCQWGIGGFPETSEGPYIRRAMHATLEPAMVAPLRKLKVPLMACMIRASCFGGAFTEEKLRRLLNVGGRGLRGVSLVFLSSCSSKKLAQAAWRQGLTRLPRHATAISS